MGLIVDSYFVIFFFQAEDGIRDFHVTGVQTCALPISLPKRVRRLGLQMAIASRAQSGKLTLVDSFGIQGKTREFVAWAKQNGIDGSERVLLVTDDELARRAARNLPWVDVLPGAGLNVYDVLRADRLVADAALFEGEAVR